MSEGFSPAAANDLRKAADLRTCLCRVSCSISKTPRKPSMTVDRELWVYIPSLRSSCTTRLLCSTPERYDTKNKRNLDPCFLRVQLCNFVLSDRYLASINAMCRAPGLELMVQSSNVEKRRKIRRGPHDRIAMWLLYLVERRNEK